MARGPKRERGASKEFPEMRWWTSLQDVKSGYIEKVYSARPDSQPTKWPPIRGDLNILSEIKNKTDVTVYELLELSVQLNR